MLFPMMKKNIEKKDENDVHFHPGIFLSLKFDIYCLDDLLTTQLQWCYCTAYKR